MHPAAISGRFSQHEISPTTSHTFSSIDWKCTLFDEMDRTDEFFRAQEIVLLERLHAIDEHGLLVAESEDFMREVLLLREHATKHIRLHQDHQEAR